MIKKSRSKYFPYGYSRKDIIGYHIRTREPVYVYKHVLPKQSKLGLNLVRFLIIFILLSIAVALAGCSTSPIVDSRGKSSANINGDMDRYHDDYYTCQSIVKDNTNVVLDKGKVVYNGFRWRILWLSPKLQTRQDLINNCLEGRGYNVLNKQ
jgi:hypothetical protein